ncbi:MAG: alkaline phosphatase [Bacteroidetes bacterium]|nr:MAG: alkaline phosphatase [Bacteroidota bacterium]
MKINNFNSVTFWIVLFTLFIASCNLSGQTDEQHVPNPKNIIVFVSDGMGFEHLRATNFYNHGQDNAQAFQQEDWIKFAMATYSSVTSTRGGDTIFSTGYNPRMASLDPGYIKNDYTDSGAAATSLSTAKKSYNGSIGIGLKGDTLTHMSQAAKALGKATGIVSSVPLSHATPAGFVAHNEHRNNYAQIAQYMFFHTATDVIMAPGNPDFDDNGQLVEGNPRYVGGQEVWDLLKANDNRTVFGTTEATFRVQDATGNGQPDPWTLIQTREEFQQMASGRTPRRVLGVPQVHATLQQGRDAVKGHTLPFQTPFNENVPTLEEMTKAAINVLNQNSNGFFVMVEGGAVDWASHNNDSARMIEEQTDFNNAVKAAIEWVEKHSSWEETLIIVTSDHECGYLTGPGKPDPIYGPVTNNGQGNLPGMQWHYGSHTNVLVPFFAKGTGAELFNLVARQTDPQYGPFIENTDMASLVFLMWGKPEIRVHKMNK